MNRLKFIVFALVAVGLFGWSLTLGPSLGADRAVQDASLALAGAPSGVALALEAQRSQLQAAALRLGASSALVTPGPKPATPVAPAPDRFTAIRSAAADGLPELQSKALVVVVGNEAGALVAQGAQTPAGPPEAFDVTAVSQAGGAGAVVTAFGAPHLFFALPLVASDKNEVKPAGFAAVGLPVLPDPRAALSKVRSELRLDAIALVAQGKTVASEGDRAAIENLVKALRPGGVVSVSDGPVDSLGPLSFPLSAPATQTLGLRQAIGGTPYELIATASSGADLVALAGFQKFGLGSLVGLLLLAGAVVALISSGKEEGAAMVVPPPVSLPPMRSSGETPDPIAVPEPPEGSVGQEASPDDFDFPALAQRPAPPMPVARPASPPQPQPPAATPFDGEPVSDPFASLAAPATPAAQQGPDADPFANAAPEEDPFASLGASPGPAAPPAPAAPAVVTTRPPAATSSKPPPPATSQQPSLQSPAAVTSQQPAYQPGPPAPAAARSQPIVNPFEDEARTVAYPVARPAAPAAAPVVDPFALASAQLAPEEQQGEGDYNPDATRVAAVPAELIKAARQASSSGMTAERPALSPKITGMIPRVSVATTTSTPSVGASGALDEERHFQEVFKDFVATREKCNEPADGLTYDKFKAKLLKNKEQLVQKYACKSVRFQVYVKDGKAALKATPVKE
jgi:hypothetical protein